MNCAIGLLVSVNVHARPVCATTPNLGQYHLCQLLQGLEFMADNKEEQSRTLQSNVASVNEELQGIVASLHTGTHRLGLVRCGHVAAANILSECVHGLHYLPLKL